MELVQNIVAILEERDPTPIKIDVEASYSAFMDGMDASATDYFEEIAKNAEVGEKNISQTPKLKISRRSIKFLLAAAIIMTLLGCTVIAGAFGLWEYVINWGKETFQIGDSADISGHQRYQWHYQTMPTEVSLFKQANISAVAVQ